jgi:CRP-like cAMP-binding protein
LQEFEKLGREARLAAREPLFLEDEVAEAVFNVTEGVVRLCKLLPDGRRQVIGFALPGDFLGAALGDRHTFSACAVGPVTVCKTSRISFWQFVGSQTGILRRMNEFAARELDQAQEQMLLLGRRTAEEKVASFLVGWRDRLVRAGGDPVADEPPGHCRFSRADDRNGEPHPHQARARRRDRHHQRRGAALRHQARGSDRRGLVRIGLIHVNQ